MTQNLMFKCSQPFPSSSLLRISLFLFFQCFIFSLPKEAVFWQAEGEAKFIYRIMDTQGEGGEEQKPQRSMWRESELGGSHFALSTLQLLKSEKELERKE